MLSLALLLVGCGGSTVGKSVRDASPEALLDVAVVSTGADDGGFDAQTSSDGGVTDNDVTVSCMVELSDYDQTCATDSDCVAVRSGYVCGDPCPNSAINVSGIDSFNVAYQAALPAHAPGGLGVVCASTQACCRAGLCAATTACEPVDAAETAVEASPPGDLHLTILCVADAGAMDSGTEIPGLSRWCNGPEVCTAFNGGWECCTPAQGAFQMCTAP